MRKLTVLVAAMFIPALALQAQEEPTKMTAEDESLSLFAQLDADKNGLLSKEEAQRVESIVAMFDALDADGDGQLSLSEFEAQVRN